LTKTEDRVLTAFRFFQRLFGVDSQGLQEGQGFVGFVAGLAATLGGVLSEDPVERSGSEDLFREELKELAFVHV
jgi:hypothetical protein